MGITAGELATICEELNPRLAGIRVLKAHQPRARELVLTCRNGEGKLRLLLSLHPRHARLHLLGTPRTNPPEPPPFVMIVRRHLEGARLLGLEATPGDRVVKISFRRGETLPSLVAELFSGRAALVLLDGAGRVLASTRTELSGGRTARPGETYRPSPRASRAAPAPAPEGPGSVHDLVAEREERAEESLRLEDARRGRLRVIDRERKKLVRLVEKLERDRDHLAEPEVCRLRGEALKAALHEVPRGAEEVTLTAWTDAGPEPVRVPLDPRRSPRENMERWFGRARRSERGSEHITRRLATSRTRLESLDDERERIRTARDAEALGPDTAPRAPARKRVQAPAGPPRFRSADDYEIVVGRSAEENETVTFRIARGNDTWLHVRDRPGAHVVVRTPPGKPPPLETLLDAATLAVHHGSARGSSGVEVSYTLRKHVRRLKGAPRGTVSVASEKTLRVDPDPDRLERLYATRVTTP